eukprot:CAMPEP_0113973038 /NCGR_PEP_ID=MMETSP0011_2-20120614/14017_1 /TAXON_ID=101924 /ORGANISM="Rhodosorus marinus" /LENGTH=148 /DNA_ID=CAMNT_0000990495 /DNA_START=1032 /DNA_END=1478 /DNA_ORIENTATION=+ /assembly_acc=CAM_ASM_000156
MAETFQWIGLQQTERLLNNLPRCDFIVVNRNLLDEFENHGISRKHHRATENTKGERTERLLNNLPRCDFIVVNRNLLDEFENHGISRKHHRATENTKGERKSQSSNCLILVASTMSLSNFLWSYPADSGSGCQCGEVAMGRVVELGLS